MHATTLEALKELALDCARSAGELSLRRMNQPFTVEYKTSASDLVTAVDKEVEKHVIDAILRQYPEHGILGEERTFTGDPGEYDTLWVIDPIDGTTNFVHQQINFAVSIAVYHKGEGLIGVVYDPSRDEMFHAVKGQGAYLNGQRLRLEKTVSLEEALLCTSVFWNKQAEQMGIDLIVKKLAGKVRGMRLLGSAALEMAYVAAGRLDGYVSLSLNAWDFGAGRILVEEAGGKVTTMDGKPLPFDRKSSVMACNTTFYEELQHYIQSEQDADPS
ncbi:inositol monophosphatase [Brevibacillus borstelensis]|uniref:inositol monophosphatase family protein n=1 Tax=Brevibacillus borstelensis TaxID=45462 RepID=UPI001D0AD699|nr:inositol monophosphatase family protein [Brevibacillus borstelensis]MCC0565514.1 inositol monophosphatase [Brevibacillus borstelensis]MCM3559706.1 inositol monophosphatase [Brevibacillus borstelensis]MCM3591089.1 inositol monophosphatase [Brevibacillus borstelensis]